MTYSITLNALDIDFSMLLSLLTANIRILSSFFFLFLVIFHNIFVIPFAIEKHLSKACACNSNWHSSNTNK